MAGADSASDWRWCKLTLYSAILGERSRLSNCHTSSRVLHTLLIRVLLKSTPPLIRTAVEALPAAGCSAATMDARMRNTELTMAGYAAKNIVLYKQPKRRTFAPSVVNMFTLLVSAAGLRDEKTRDVAFRKSRSIARLTQFMTYELYCNTL